MAILCFENCCKWPILTPANGALNYLLGMRSIVVPKQWHCGDDRLRSKESLVLNLISYHFSIQRVCIMTNARIAFVRDFRLWSSRNTSCADNWPTLSRRARPRRWSWPPTPRTWRRRWSGGRRPSSTPRLRKPASSPNWLNKTWDSLLNWKRWVDFTRV